MTYFVNFDKSLGGKIHNKLKLWLWPLLCFVAQKKSLLGSLDLRNFLN